MSKGDQGERPNKPIQYSTSQNVSKETKLKDFQRRGEFSADQKTTSLNLEP